MSKPPSKLFLGIGIMAIGLALIIGALFSVSWDRPSEEAEADPNPSVFICSEFENWEEAEVYFSSLDDAVKSTSGLDSNRNGVPCEMLKPPSPELSDLPFEVICGDFRHREESRLFFENQGGPDIDPYGLDSDRDGVPCEWLPSYDDFDEVIEKFLDDDDPPRDSPTSDRDCSDFANWGEANRFFLQSGAPGADPHRLDGDGNGIPCESLPGAP